MEKYKLLKNDCRIYGDTEVYRIQALKDFGDIKKDELGGYVEDYKNLSHSGNCWIYDKSVVYRNGQILNNATVRENSTINDALIMDDVRISRYTYVSGDIILSGNAEIRISPLFFWGIGYDANTNGWMEVRIACECHKIRYWEKNYKEIAKRYSISKGDVKIYLSILETAKLWFRQNRQYF